jgi:hypothetical protein
VARLGRETHDASGAQTARGLESTSALEPGFFGYAGSSSDRDDDSLHLSSLPERTISGRGTAPVVGAAAAPLAVLIAAPMPCKLPAEAIGASAAWSRMTRASPNRIEPTRNEAAAAAVVSGRGDQEAPGMQTGYPHRCHYTYFSNDTEPLNGRVVFTILVTRPRKLAERGNGVSGDDGARRLVPMDPA